MPGYVGKQLSVDLASGKVEVGPLDAEIVKQFIGGIGYGSKVIYDETSAKTDPLGPENVIVFSMGPLSGTVPFSGRLDVSTKSPINGLMTMSSMGGLLPVEIKKAGYDVIIVRKSSPVPVYLWIDDDKVEIRRADALWGKNTWETSEDIRRELGEKSGHEIKVAAIGPAGENRIRFASLVSQRYHAAGRGGVGAVMGSKKLKAIAVRGTKKIPVAKPEELERASREVVNRVMNSWNPISKAGVRVRWTMDGLFMCKDDYESGTLGVKNYQTTVFPEWLDNNTIEQVWQFDPKPLPTCHRCPFSCFWEVDVKDGKYAGLKAGGIEFSTQVLWFGGLCGIVGLPAIWSCKSACQKLGMDYWSAGNILSFAMELYQRGIITKADTGGIDLKWGDGDAALQMLEQIAHRRGLGDILARGSAAAAKHIGKDAIKYTYTIKDDEMYVVDPRSGAVEGKSKFLLFGNLDSPRGGEDVKTTHGFLDRIPTPEMLEKLGMSEDEYFSKYAQWLDIFEEEKKQIFGVPPRLSLNSWDGIAAFAKWSGNVCSLISSLGLCIFSWTRGGDIGPTYMAKMMSACTGVDVTPAELMKVGERVFNLQRKYLVNCGFSSKDEDFPAKFYDDPLPDGPAKGAHLSREEIEKVRQEYYKLRGWDKTGVPSAEKLRSLGLAD